MAYKAYKPYEVDFRKISNIRGKANDRCTGEQRQAFDYKPWGSTYEHDFAPGTRRKSGARNGNNTGHSLPALKVGADLGNTVHTEREPDSAREAPQRFTTATNQSLKTDPKCDGPYRSGDDEFIETNVVKNVFPDPQNP